MYQNNKKQIYLLLSIILFFLVGNITAQETMVVGQVLNSADKSPVAQVNITFKNTVEIVQSNNEGYFLIKTSGKQTTLVLSCIGFKKQEINIKHGQSVGIDVQLEEESTMLQEAFVIPGINPAIELIKKVQLMRKNNDLSSQPNFSAQSTEQNLVLLSKINQQRLSKQILNQLKKGAISSSDTSLVVPLYMAEYKYLVTKTNKTQLSRNIFSSPENGEKILEKLVGEMATELNFYHNTISVMGKNMVSPLANVGFAYYNYYLADSALAATGKQYEIHFRTINPKNLAFDGKMWIDSASLALTKIDLELPAKANLNFIRNLQISERFEQQKNRAWARQSEEMALNMNYELLGDSLHPRPEIFVKRSAIYQTKDSTLINNNSFAQSNYSQESLDSKLSDLNKTPLLRTAKWIADAFFTSYMQVGKIDIGRVQQIMRITDVEGFRLTMPFCTNEKLWQNLSLGGYIGYGFKNNTVKYAGLAHYKIPGKKRQIISLSYANDFRRVDYNYNDNMFRENPLVTGDEDISSSLFAMKSAGKVAERKEYSLSFANDWNPNIESNIYLRYNQLLPNSSMPMLLQGIQIASFLQHQSATFTTRFSLNEKTYDDHMQRIYISNKKPVIYSILEVGNYQLGNKSGQYGKILAKMKHIVNFDFVELNYIAEAGLIIGSVPYPLLEVPPGSETGGYSTYQFNMMNYMEYAADKYINIHSELTFNGLIMNQIPIIKQLNLREICSFNIAYGSLNDKHKTLLDYPTYMNPLTKPYVEVGVGFSNIFKIFTLQSVWRLTDLNRSGVIPWGLRGCLRLSF